MDGTSGQLVSTPNFPDREEFFNRIRRFPPHRQGPLSSQAPTSRAFCSQSGYSSAPRGKADGPVVQCIRPLSSRTGLAFGRFDLSGSALRLSKKPSEDRVAEELDFSLGEMVLTDYRFIFVHTLAINNHTRIKAFKSKLGRTLCTWAPSSADWPGNYRQRRKAVTLRHATANPIDQAIRPFLRLGPAS